MKKNIIIIGHGDLGNRLTRILNDEYKVFHISRNNKFESSNFIEWDWLSKDGLNIEAKTIDTVIFFPKPSKMDDKGYINGFINSSKNIYRELCNLPINKFISIFEAGGVSDKKRISSIYGNMKIVLSDDPSLFKGIFYLIKILAELMKIISKFFLPNSVVKKIQKNIIKSHQINLPKNKQFE